MVEKEGAVGAHPWLEEGCCKLSCFLHEHHVVTRDSSGKKNKGESIRLEDMTTIGTVLVSMRDTRMDFRDTGAEARTKWVKMYKELGLWLLPHVVYHCLLFSKVDNKEQLFTAEV